MSSRPGRIRRFFGGLWRFIDFSRRLVLNLIFLALIAVLIVAWVATEKPPALQAKTALVLAIQGDLVEQYTGGAPQAAITRALGQEQRETQLRDVTDAIDAAASDAAIDRIVLILDDMDGAGLASLREVTGALDRFRSEGKEVVAWGNSYDQKQYLLAAHADEIYMHPMGAVTLRGLGGYTAYYKELLDKLGVTVNVFRAGKFKSFAEPFTRTGPSPEAQQADAFWLNNVWATYTGDVETARKLPAGSIASMIDKAPERLAAVDGDMARLAVESKLVDGLKTRDEFRAMMVERGAVSDKDPETFRQIVLTRYLDYLNAPDVQDAIGVIVAQGEIVDGDEPQGVVGGRSTAELIAKAREDKDVKALVLRVDSPGGSAFASEVIRRELVLTQQKGKPVVVSMANVAASGGYWISMSADEIIADPATITGSIGVFGLLPSFDKTLEKVGVNTAGTTTTWLAGANDPRRPLDKRYGEMVQSSVSHTYQQFLNTAAQGRHSTAEKINDIAQGRVWSGAQAQERGLVDTMGGLDTALESAAQRANIEGEYRVMYIERESRGWDEYLSLLMGSAISSAQSRLGWDIAASGFGKLARGDIKRDLRVFGRARDLPFAAYSYCFCRAL